MSNLDPTYADMHAFLMPYLAGIDDATVWDFEEAIYWYAHDHHAGQSTNLYVTLSSASPYKPGAYNTGLSDGAALELYQRLQEKFGGA